ncbi:MAG: hypothetical protein H6Q73_942 [Firmicutes bacterium]|nr:hypothetical protein [Bacillota bacterium]
MNHQQLSRSRDFEIVKTLESWRALSTRQIQVMFFPSLFPAQRRMSILAQRKKVSFIRLYDNPSWYFVGKEPKEIERYITLNWIRLWLVKNKKSWQVYQDWVYDIENYAAQVRVFNTWQGTYQELNIEYNPAGKFIDEGESAWSFGSVIKEEKEKIKRLLVAEVKKNGVLSMSEIMEAFTL